MLSPWEPSPSPQRPGLLMDLINATVSRAPRAFMATPRETGFETGCCYWSGKNKNSEGCHNSSTAVLI